MLSALSVTAPRASVRPNNEAMRPSPEPRARRFPAAVVFSPRYQAPGLTKGKPYVPEILIITASVSGPSPPSGVSSMAGAIRAEGKR